MKAEIYIDHHQNYFFSNAFLINSSIIFAIDLFSFSANSFNCPNAFSESLNEVTFLLKNVKARTKRERQSTSNGYILCIRPNALFNRTWKKIRFEKLHSVNIPKEIFSSSIKSKYEDCRQL